MLLLYTVLICLHLKQPLTPTEVNRLMINAAARAPRRSRYAHRTS
jgi:hypothetical protein